jgi:putative ABC transport system permease protein
MLYKSETRTGVLFNVFAAFAVFISCLGLFGLTTYTAQVRTKEIGIRKTLGASAAVIVRLLTVDFIRLILLAIIIATPIAWYGAYKWLENYAYKIKPGWYLFAGAGLLVVLVSVITISFQSIRSARANPVKALRTE